MRSTIAFLLLAGLALAQTTPPPAFEVASVRINEPFLGRDNRWRGTVETAPGALTMRKVTFLTMLNWAYGLPAPQISGPSWLELETYDIVAKAGRPAQKDEMRPMLQTLLADRFKLVVHRESREIPALALMEAKGGHKMKPSESEGPPQTIRDPVKGSVALRFTMAEFAEVVAEELRLPVVDMTGLKGRYDFAFNIRAYIPAPDTPSAERPGPVTIFQTALQKEAGLRLESRKAPLDVLVIDHVEKKPPEN